MKCEDASREYLLELLGEGRAHLDFVRAIADLPARSGAPWVTRACRVLP